ncbi:hypothetical protein FQA39_LY05099 [Lamprigera yunnana]|nr:hypothetical protein FQA39_LY05099 [Lamprigera yunnana]
MGIFLLVTVIINYVMAYGIEDYCSVNQFPVKGHFMEFTKEPSTAEFAIVGKFKGIHCCAKGYWSIEWYKDGKPYPWLGVRSPLIIYPESVNQTVYTQAVTMDGAGSYTCLLRNDSMVYNHTINLEVFERVPYDPKITYISEDTEISLGQSIRLFCEAFVGRVDLPDTHYEVIWSKYGENRTFENDSRISQIKISREDNQTFGTFLIIKDSKKEDCGKYMCTISKPGKTIELFTRIYETRKNTFYINPNPVPYKKLLLVGAITVILFFTILILNLQYGFGLFLRVKLKDRFGRLPENDDKVNDVIVLYSQKDSELALGVLLQTLESKYNYKCGSRQLPQNINIWYKDLLDASYKSHRIVAVISPSAVGDCWECPILHQILKQLCELDPQFCCVTLKEFPSNGEQIKNSSGESFSSLVRNINVINWERSREDKFWLSLRLKLPPKRCNQINLKNNTPKNLTRLNSITVEMAL